MPHSASNRKSYEPWREALRELDNCLKDTKDRHDRSILLGHIAMIELLIHIKRSLDRVPIQYGEEH